MDLKDRLLTTLRDGGTLSFGEQVRLTAILSTPAILAQLSSVLMQYIDASMVGHLGAAAGASIGLVSTCIWLLGGFLMACSSGFSVQVAHLVGAKDLKAARQVVREGMVSVLIFSALLAIVSIAVAWKLPYWLGGNEEIAGDATRYFLIQAVGLPLMQMVFFGTGMLQCSGNMKVPSLLNINMCLLDVAFNYFFIYVLGRGVTGAALGTLSAALVTALLMTGYLAFRSKELNLRQDSGSFRPTGKVIRNAFGIGGPMGLQNIIMRGAHIASTVIVAPLGTISIAANSFAITAESFCYMPGFGIADAATTLVGQSLGARRKDLAKRFAWIATGGGMAIMTVLGMLMFIFAPVMMGLVSPDAEVVELGARMLRIEAFAETMYAASIVAYGACLGAGDTFVPSILNFVSMWIIRILPAAFLTPMLGLKGYWIAMCIELNFRGIAFLIRLARNSWITKSSKLSLHRAEAPAD